MLIMIHDILNTCRDIYHKVTQQRFNILMPRHAVVAVKATPMFECL